MRVGDVCIKVAGRDAGKVCVVVDILDNNRVLVDGETRRRKVNPVHLALIGKQARVEKGASHEKVLEAIKSAKELEPVKVLEQKSVIREEKVVKVKEKAKTIKEEKKVSKKAEEKEIKVKPAKKKAVKKE